ncbi:MAG: hypothetical protein J6L69_02935 [Lachnospiraceae bacterium]|nr:hypothetical protein [Lachnospiraceae bacterium]
MLKQLNLIDLIPFMDDNLDVNITAYNIPLFTGKLKDLPAIYAPYEITERLTITDNKLNIVLDC